MSVGKHGRTVLLLLIGVLCGIGLTLFAMDESGWWERETKLDPALPFLEIAPEVISRLTYTNKSMTLTAQRTKDGAEFAVQATFADGRTPQHCISTPDLGGVLASFALIMVKQQTRKERIPEDYPVTLGVVELKDGIINEPPHPQHYFASRDLKAVATVQESVAFETTIPAAMFKKLEAGCAELAKR